MSITAVILDDEERNSKLLLKKLQTVCDEIDVVAIFNDSVLALKEIRKLK